MLIHPVSADKHSHASFFYTISTTYIKLQFKNIKMNNINAKKFLKHIQYILDKKNPPACHIISRPETSLATRIAGLLNDAKSTDVAIEEEESLDYDCIRLFSFLLE